MRVAETLTGYAVTASFAVLALSTGLSWLRHRDRSRGYLALAIVLFGIQPSLSEIQALVRGNPPWFLGESILLAFIGSGYALLRFRDVYLPLGAGTRRLARAATLLSVAVSFGVSYYGQDGTPALLLGGTGLIAAVWLVSVLEPALQFWRASRLLAPLQRARLRALSFGFGGLAVLIALDLVGLALLGKQLWSLLLQICALGLVPMLYVSFAPPGWLRRQWRAGIEEEARSSLDSLLVAGTERSALAGATLVTAMRLVGAQAGAVIDSDGSPLAVRGLGAPAVAGLDLDLVPPAPTVRRVELAGLAAQAAMLLPLRTQAGPGAFILFGGPFTPAFATDELACLEQYVVTVAAVLSNAEARQQLEGERRRLEEANTRLEAASKHKSVFLANMSHELRTPLNAIIGFSELLIDDVDGTFDAETRLQFIEQVRTSGQHLLALINDILDLSKVEAGQMELHLEQVRLGAVVAGVGETVLPLIQQKCQRLVTDVDDELELEADRVKLRQMLLNLVSNAIKFTPDGGEIRIAAEAVDGWLTIAVSDTGVGIAAADQERVFEEFRQLDSGSDRRQSGTGLGLALTRRFVELHGGSIAVHSAPAQGSTFTLRMPRRPEAADEAPWPGSSEPGSGRPMVLVVEDNPQAADLLSRHLRRGGFEAALARTGPDALRLAKELPIVAITLDILIPEMDGWDVLANLRNDPETSGIPVLVVSVVDDPTLGRALGASDYLVKPIDGDVLLACLRRHLSAPGSLPRKRVLAVDDEPANLELLKAMLEPEDFEVLVATGGAEGIRMARERRPALVLLDLVMPEVDGFAVVEAVRADPATADIPILILTSKDLTNADKAALNGQVAAIFDRHSTAAADLVDWLSRMIALVDVA